MEILIHPVFLFVYAIIVLLVVVVIWKSVKEPEEVDKHEESAQRSVKAQVVRGLFIALLLVGGCTAVDFITLRFVGKNASTTFQIVEQKLHQQSRQEK